jgi:hypothetical protein
MTLVAERAQAGVVRALRPAGAARSSAALRAVLMTLPVAALAELLLNRVFYRVGIFIPKQGPFRAVYAASTAAGTFALDLSSVLAIAALSLLALAGLRHADRRTGVALAVFVLAILLTRAVGVEPLGPASRFAFSLAVLAVSVPFVRSVAEASQRALVAAVAVCFLLSTYAGIGQAPGVDGAPGVAFAQILAEGLVVVAGGSAFAAWARADGIRVRPVLLAAPLAASFMAAWWANGAIAGILVLWTVGLRLYLWPWLYALALWAFAAAMIGWLQGRPRRGVGLALLVVAGMLLGSTYQQALGLIALVLLTDGVAVGGLPSFRAR